MYWQRLRRDARSNVAAVLAGVAALAGTVSVVVVAVPGAHHAARASPFYWLLMLPLAWWGSGLATFGARYVRLWTPALALACLGSGASLAVAAWRGDWGMHAAGFAITASAAAASLVARRGSLVAREGPAR